MAPRNPVVHLELHTPNLPRACAFYTGLFDWRARSVASGGTHYLTLALRSGLEGGVVEEEGEQALWVPYVEVCDVVATTERARELGAAVLVETREGPAGWRSVLDGPSAGEFALWQPKR